MEKNISLSSIKYKEYTSGTITGRPICIYAFSQSKLFFVYDKTPGNKMNKIKVKTRPLLEKPVKGYKIKRVKINGKFKNIEEKYGTPKPVTNYFKPAYKIENFINNSKNLILIKIKEYDEIRF
jgi:hypothetical protein